MANKTTTKRTSKTTTPLTSACEQYVVDELIKAKQELAQVKESLEIVRGQRDFLHELVEKGTKALDFDENGNSFRYLKVDGSYACSIYKDETRESQQLRDFIKLVEYGKGMVKRD